MSAILCFPHHGATLAELSAFVDQAHALGIPPNSPLDPDRTVDGEPAIGLPLPNRVRSLATAEQPGTAPKRRSRNRT